MMHKTYTKRATRRFLVLLGLGWLMFAGSLHVAGPAYADSEGYLAEITNHNIAIKDVRGAVELGYYMCNQLSTERGDQLVRQMWLAEPNPVWTQADFSTVLWAAVHNLCPWHDHSLHGAAVGGAYA